MLEKCIVLIILYAALLAYDIPKWKQYTRKERRAYIGIMLVSVYLSIIYLTELPWPNLIDLIHALTQQPVEQIMNHIRSAS